MTIYPREDEYLREDLEAIFDEFMEIVSSCPSSFIVHWAWNRGVSVDQRSDANYEKLEKKLIIDI